MTKQYEQKYILGMAPKHIQKEDVLQYFLYAFELSWSMPMFIDQKDKMMSFFVQEVEKEFLSFEDLSIEQTWWLCVFIAMREINKYYSSEFAVQTLSQLIRRIQRIEEGSLCRYANIFQAIMLEEHPDVLAIRPLELHALSNVFAESDKLLQFFIENKTHIVCVIKKHLIQQDLNDVYLNSVLMKDRRVLRKFSNIWNSFYELFIHFFIAVYDYKLSPLHMGEEELKNAIGDLVLIFLVNGVSNKRKIDELHDELSLIVQNIAM
ncbi:hypothetical protein JOD82_001684 [Paenibacillus sp. 1182]|uniref:hypothetical protein n=1 Tax=Paenibacillus sp. 1182 TaxID=2806565 RepID=UPI001AE6C069|nr:hypothetical protein [Paenibacillus sp. 1182]MBP1308664.1 hypothetical protein [Paenibacillus sp. 1182]